MHSKVTRWPYAVAGTTMLLFLGLIYAWSIFRAPLSQVFPTWTAGNLSLNFSISMCCFCFGGFFGGKLSAKTSNRITVIVTAILMLIGFFTISLLNVSDPKGSLKMLYLFYGVFCGLGAGMGYNAIVSAVIKWFPEKTGAITGILLMGYGFGGMILGSAANMLINSPNFGLFSTFRIIAVTVAIVLIVGSFYIKLPPEGTILPPKPKAREGDLEKRDFTASQMLRTSSFWIYFFYGLTIAASGLLVINSAAPIASYFGAPAVLGLIVSVANGLGRVSFGALFDKLGRSKAMLLNCIVLILAGITLVVGALAYSIPFVVVGLILTGLSYGGSAPINSSVIFDLFGSKHYAVNFSLLIFNLIPAALIGPMISTSLQTASAGGNLYLSTFVMLIAFGAIALFLRRWVK